MLCFELSCWFLRTRFYHQATEQEARQVKEENMRSGIPVSQTYTHLVSVFFFLHLSLEKAQRTISVNPLRISMLFPIWMLSFQRASAEIAISAARCKNLVRVIPMCLLHCRMLDSVVVFAISSSSSSSSTHRTRYKWVNDRQVFDRREPWPTNFARSTIRHSSFTALSVTPDARCIMDVSREISRQDELFSARVLLCVASERASAARPAWERARGHTWHPRGRENWEFWWEMKRWMRCDWAFAGRKGSTWTRRGTPKVVSLLLKRSPQTDETASCKANSNALIPSVLWCIPHRLRNRI